MGRGWDQCVVVECTLKWSEKIGSSAVAGFAESLIMLPDALCFLPWNVYLHVLYCACW